MYSRQFVHRGMIRKAGVDFSLPPIIEDEIPREYFIWM